MFERFGAWWSSARILGITALIAGFGLSIWPRSYDNPSYRVLFAYVTARQAGMAWMVLGLVSILATSRWSIAAFGAALIGWGLGFGTAALTDAPSIGHGPVHRSGSPLGWVWFVGFGVAVLRTLVVGGPQRMRS